MGDLADHEVIVLGRGSRVPRRCAGAYMFDPVTPAELEDLLQQARDLAAIMGGAVGVSTTTTVVADVWRISAVGHIAFGSEVPVETVATAAVFIARDDVGLVLLDGVWTTCGRALPDEKPEAFGSRCREGPGRDPRLLARSIQRDGRRLFPFPDLVGAVKEVPMVHWPISGPRSV